MRAACVQMCSNDDLAANLAAAGRLLDEATGRGAELVVLPENFALMGGDAHQRRRLAEDLCRAEVMPFLADRARRHRLYIVGGSILTAGRDGRVRNACPVFGPDGTCLAGYDKLHLFDVELPGERYRESDRVVPGERPVWIDAGAWRLGLSICYDLRFPELYRHYALAGCQALTVPAAFTVPTGRAHWEILLRARAIENQSYVLAAAQSGGHPGNRQTWGHSMIVDPWGEVVARTGGEPSQAFGLVVAELDREHMLRVRRQLPALEQCRLAF